MSYYSKVCLELEAAAHDGIISPQQTEAMKKRFNENSSTSVGSTAVKWLGAISGFFIALGLILLIAFNWATIGDYAKIAGYLLLLFVIGFGCIKCENKPVIQKVLGTIWFFMPAMGIGLYAQIFQLSASPLKPLLLWALLSAPLAIFFESKLYSRLLSALLIVTLFQGVYTSGSAINLEMYTWKNLPVIGKTLHCTYVVLLLAAGLGINFYKKDKWSLPIFATLLWLASLFISNTFLRIKSDNLVNSAFAALSVFFFLWETKKHSKIVNRGLYLWLLLVYIFTFIPTSTMSSGGNNLFTSGSIAAMLLIILVIVAILIVKPIEKTENAGTGIPQKNTEWTAFSVIKSFMIVSAAFPLLPLIFKAVNWKFLSTVANILLLSSGIVLFWLGKEKNSVKTLTIGMVVIVTTAVTRFFDLFGSQLTTGMVFILTGLLLAFVTWWFAKGAKKLAISEKGGAHK